MNTQVRQGETLQPLDAWMAGHGPLNQQELAGFLRELALQLVALHDQGRIHANLVASEIGITDSSQPRLIAATSELPDFLELSPELAPPEIRPQLAGMLPRSLVAASQALSAAGAAFDARRIDVYQLGALAVQLAAGVNAHDYLQSPRAAAKIPTALRPVVDRALGISPAQRLATCTQLLAELDPTNTGASHAAVVPAVQTEARETPSRGVAISSDTDVLKKQREQARRQRETGELPFERLGNYEIVARLGSGGMGDVFKGYDASLDRFVAIKVLPREFAQQEEFVGRFRAEAAAAAKVEHPNIVPIYTIGSEQDRHFFAMQFVDGQTLGQLLTQQPRLAPEQSLKIVEQVVSGLAAAHRFGLVHRDIKPGNILLADGGRRALVADFGLVKSIGQSHQMTATGVVMGTVDYISPEQGRGKTVDGRSDLYSIGVLLYQMLAGKLPFSADTPTAMIFQHAYEPPPPLVETAPQTPLVLAQIVHRLLAKAPAERYQTCEDLLDDLVAFRSGQAPPHLSGAAVARETGPRTAIILAPKFVEHDLPPVPEREAEPAIALRNRWSWEYAKQYVFFWLKQKAPELVRRLENTQQQVDGAVFEYEQRCESLGRLVSEAQAVQRLLEIQLKEHTAAAAIARKRKAIAQDDEALEEATAQCVSNESAAAQLQQQVLQQGEELEAMQLEFAKASARLTNLRSQRAALQARLKVAQARYGLSDGRKGLRRQLPYVLGGIAACAIAALVLSFLLGLFSIPFVGSQKPSPNPEFAGVSELHLVLDATGQQTTLPFRPVTIQFIGDEFDDIVVGGEDGSLLSATISQKERFSQWIHRFPPHGGSVTSLSWNRITNRLASASSDGDVRIWDSSRNLFRQLAQESAPRGMTFSSDGTQLLVGGQKDTRLWDVVSGIDVQRYVEPRYRSESSSLAWLPDSSGFVRAGRISNAPSTFVVSKDGSKWLPLDTTTPVTNVAVMNGGREIIGEVSGSLRVWNSDDGSQKTTFATAVTCAAYSQQSRRVLTGHSDGKVVLWETATGKRIQEFKMPGRVQAVGISNRSQYGVAASGNELRLFLLQPEVVPYRRQRLVASASIQAIAVAPNQFRAISAGDQVHTWNLENDGQGSGQITGAGPAGLVAFSPNGGQFLVARTASKLDDNGTITLRNPEKVRQFLGHRGGTTALQFVDNGAAFVSGGNDNYVRKWQVSTEAELQSIDVGAAVRSLAASPSGNEVAVARNRDPQCEIWNMETKVRLGTLAGHSLSPRKVVWSRSSSRVATASDDRTVRVWDATTLQCLATLKHRTAVTALDITKDGKWLIVGTQDGYLQIWDVDAERPGASWWAHESSVVDVKLLPDERTAVSAGEDRVLNWWDVLFQ